MNTEENQLEDIQQESDDLYIHQTIVVDPKQEPLRIDKFLMDRMQRVSRNKVQEALRQGVILVNDSPVKPNHKVKGGQIITLVLPGPPREDSLILAENIPLDIKYEDDHLLVINKPAGLVVHPGVGNRTGTLVNALAWHLSDDKEALEKDPYVESPGLVHRIDKNTSGIMVIPKTDQAATHLANQFFHHTIDRSYLALVWGEPSPHEGTIEGNLGRHPKNRILMAVFPEGDEGKEAITHYEVIEPMYYVSLVRCTLETGRTHQIRVHMKYKGHTVFSDERYGGSEILKGTVFTKYKQFVQNCFKLIPRQALHAFSLGFEHPATGERVYFEQALPEDFEAVLAKWRAYLSSRKEKLEDDDEVQQTLADLDGKLD